MRAPPTRGPTLDQQSTNGTARCEGEIGGEPRTAERIRLTLGPRDAGPSSVDAYERLGRDNYVSATGLPDPRRFRWMRSLLRLRKWHPHVECSQLGPSPLWPPSGGRTPARVGGGDHSSKLRLPVRGRACGACRQSSWDCLSGSRVPVVRRYSSLIIDPSLPLRQEPRSSSRWSSGMSLMASKRRLNRYTARTRAPVAGPFLQIPNAFSQELLHRDDPRDPARYTLCAVFPLLPGPVWCDLGPVHVHAQARIANPHRPLLP